MATPTAGRKKSVPWNTPPVVRPPTTVERVFHQRLVSRSVYYLTTGRQLRPERLHDVAGEPSPFRAAQEAVLGCRPPSEQELARRRERTLPFADKHGHRSRQRSDVLERLHVPEREVGDVAADVDSGLLRLVEGRPIKEKLNLRRYVRDVRDNLVGRLATGYLEDEVLLLEERLSIEQRELDAARRAHRSYADSFDQMMNQNHEESMAVMRRHEEGARLLEAVIAELHELQKRLSAARARVYVLAESWADCKLYQSFLYQASPVTWQQEHGIRIANTVSGITAQHAPTNLADEDSLEVIISKFSAEVITEAQPQLYFTDSEQLLELFSDMEYKNLDSLLHLESLSESLHEMQKVRREVEESFQQEVSAMTATISEFKTAIEWEEKRAAELESYARKLMSTTFRDLVVSDDLLKLKVFVEDTYEAVIAKNESNLKMIDMKAAIEARCDQLMLQLDQYPRSLVRDVKQNVFTTADRKMREARYAAIKVQLMDRLIRRLKKSLEPPVVKVGKPIHFRSPPPRAKRKPKPKPRELTQKQKDFLEFFTDYCQYTDSVGTYIAGF